MSDELTPTAEVQPQETSQVSEEAPVVEDQTPVEEATEQPEPASESQQQPPRPTRAEKRLSQLLERNRQQPARDSFSEYANSLPAVAPSEDGSITQDQLQQLIAQETAKNLSLAREMDTYHATVNEFTNEVESVGTQLDTDFKDNPKLAEKLNGILTEMIEKANVRYNSQGQQVLVPSIKPSAIYGQLKEALQLAQGMGTEKANANLAQQIADSAVTPSTRQTQELDASTLTPEQIWANPRAARDSMRSKLTVAQD